MMNKVGELVIILISMTVGLVLILIQLGIPILVVYALCKYCFGW